MAFNQFDPIRGYKAGKEVAKDSGILDAFGASEEERKFQRQLQLETHKASLKRQGGDEDVGVYSFSPYENKLQEVARVRKGSIVRNEQPTLDDRNQAAINKKEALGAGAQSGGINAAIQAKKSSDKALSILFPDKTPGSFRRDIAAKKGLLGSTTLSEEGQNLKREYGIALDMFNKQVTGLAFSDKEYQNRLNQFQVDLLSNPAAAYESIKKLGDMSTDYLKIADPSGMYYQQGSEIEQSASSGQPPVSDKNSRKQQYAQALAQYPGKKTSILQKYKDEFGEEYNG